MFSCSFVCDVHVHFMRVDAIRLSLRLFTTMTCEVAKIDYLTAELADVFVVRHNAALSYTSYYWIESHISKHPHTFY